MPRPARFDNSQILDATARLVAQHGPSGATIARIAREIQAPSGSIYHRFPSRNALLGEVWLRTTKSFQDGFIEQLSHKDPISGGQAAVRHVVQWVRDNPKEARLLLLYRQSEFLSESWPDILTQRAKDLRRELMQGISDYCDRVFGCRGTQQVQVATYALAEAPLAALRRHIEQNHPPPSITEDLIEATFLATIKLGKVP